MPSFESQASRVEATVYFSPKLHSITINQFGNLIRDVNPTGDDGSVLDDRLIIRSDEEKNDETRAHGVLHNTYVASPPMIASFAYRHTINTPAASCELHIKARGPTAHLLTETLQPNLWIDISISQHGTSKNTKNHIMRGRIQSLSIETSAGGSLNKSSATVFKLRAMSFGHILSQTQVYYDIVSEGEKLANAYPRITITPGNNFSVEDTLRTLLVGFLKEGDEGTGRPCWKLPESLPNNRSNLSAGRSSTADGPYFIDALTYLPDNDTRAIKNYPKRVNSTALSFLSPVRGGETLWSVLQRYNDNPVTDLYTDLVDATTGQYLAEGQDTSPENTAMAVIVRDKPFYTETTPSGDIEDSAWSNEKESPESGYLPVYHITFNDIVERRVVRSDEARYNAFFVAPIFLQGLTGTLLDLQSPLWDLEDIQHNGLRAMRYVTPYIPRIHDGEQSYREAISIYRRRLRDFMCLSADYYSGTITIAGGRPDIRVGGKLVLSETIGGLLGGKSRLEGRRSYSRSLEQLSFRDTDSTDPENRSYVGEYEERYYIESVAHSWNLLGGMQTNLTVSRGLPGEDYGRVLKLQKKIRSYRIGNTKQSGN